jgi:ABC-type lipoprotein export system ATPase subunit
MHKNGYPYNSGNLKTNCTSTFKLLKPHLGVVYLSLPLNDGVRERRQNGVQLVIKPLQRLELIYHSVQKQQRNYGTLKRCEFHLHTPASHDYKINGTPYNDVSDEDLLGIAMSRGVFTTQTYQEKLAMIDEWRDWERTGPRDNPFDSFKEYLAYSLLAHTLYEQKIQMVAVCDHNNINGYSKLKHALKTFYLESSSKHRYRYCTPILGVEISCSDQNHLIGIFDSKKIEMVRSYLSKIIHGMRKEEGTIYTSLQIMEEISGQLGGISYIAHINSSKKLGTGLYKTSLFSSPHLSALGFTDFSSKQSQLQAISNWTDNITDRFCFLYEGDSHDITTIGTKNTWVKFGNRIDFPALKHAFHNHNISIYPERPNQSDKFIKGVYIFPGESGFLSEDPHQDASFQGDSNVGGKPPFHVHFSRDLNCIIGGRGTGKSTLLSVIEIVMRHPEVYDRGTLDFVSRHKRICIVFRFRGEDYIIDFIPQTQNLGETTYAEVTYLSLAFTDRSQANMTDHWLTLFKAKRGSSLVEVTGKERTDVLQSMYRRGYSINKLVTDIEQGKLGEFIKRTVLDGVNFEASEFLLRGLRQSPIKSVSKFLRENLARMNTAIAERREFVERAISSFNHANQETLRIVYSPNSGNVDLYFNDVLDIIGEQRGFVAQTLLRWSDAERFVRQAIKTVGFLPFLDDLFNQRFTKIDRDLTIKKFVSTHMGTTHIDKDIRDVSPDNTRNIYQAILGVISGRHRELIHSIHQYFALSDDFGLFFNINAREHIGYIGSVFKPIEQLSLGQKVTAILTFVFKFGKHVGDNTPLIIDQPEDNLDNQYIYNTLVTSLREIKNMRQVIIVTHSSTVVTNADAEQIIVMDSDNITGWVQTEGAITERHITQHIVNHLEGGTQSFKHKMDTYKGHIQGL